MASQIAPPSSLQVSLCKKLQNSSENWLVYLLHFPLDALPEVIGLGITLITTLLING